MLPVTERVLPVLQVRRWATTGRLFAIIDACGAPAVPGVAAQLGDERAVSLYRGLAEENLSGIAPYLFRLDGRHFDWLTATLWSEPWGVFALSDGSLEDLRRHFRRFLVVESPDPACESWYFRFYDPRVLTKFLAACTPEEVKEVYGPVRAFGVTDQATYRLH